VSAAEKQVAARFAAFDQLAGDPALGAQWEALILHTRKRVLLDEYNMDPQLMYEFTRDLGPIDWRHGQAHALYWSRRGSLFGERRVANEEDIYKILNNDRQQLQAMQGLARYGRITFDPFSTELPSRFPDPRWIDTIAGQFEYFYTKHFTTRGGGGETFISFLKNFMGGAIRQAYRSGEYERAEALLEMLDRKLGRGAAIPNNQYAVPLDVFVKNEVQGQYEFQPFMAPSEAVASLRYAFRVGVGRDRPEVYENAVKFVDEVIRYFKVNEYYNFTTRFGEGRIKDLIGSLERTRQTAFLQLMTDPSIRLQEKVTIWNKVDKVEPRLRLQTYDGMLPAVSRQFASSLLSRRYELSQLFPAPPGIESYRRGAALEQERREAEAQQQRERDEFERQ